MLAILSMSLSSLASSLASRFAPASIWARIESTVACSALMRFLRSFALSSLASPGGTGSAGTGDEGEAEVVGTDRAGSGGEAGAKVVGGFTGVCGFSAITAPISSCVARGRSEGVEGAEGAPH